LEIPSSKGLGFRVPHAKQLACLLLLGISNLQKTLDKAKKQTNKKTAACKIGCKITLKLTHGDQA
jgi:hypothetical protein